jgi:hypothetical protein
MWTITGSRAFAVIMQFHSNPHSPALPWRSTQDHAPARPRRAASDARRRRCLAAADKEQTVSTFREAVNAPALVEAATACRAYERLESRYSSLRQYRPSFITLPFHAAAGSETLLQAIDVLRALDAGTRGPNSGQDRASIYKIDPQHCVPLYRAL